MLYFDHFQISSHNGFVELTADSYIQFQASGEENVEMGVPKCWPDTILERLSSGSLDVYHIDTAAIPKERVSRVTDYKGVWGILQVPRGEHGGYYDHADTRIYYGIRNRMLPSGLYDYAAPLQLLLPRTESNCLHKIAQWIDTNQIGSANSGFFAPGIFPKWLQDAYILCYHCLPTPSLKMMGPNGANFFRDEDVNRWNRAKEMAIYPLYPLD